MFYSASANGFFPANRSRPSDAVSITAEEHAALLAGQARGQIIVADSRGRPVLANQPPQPLNGAAIDRERDRRIAAGLRFDGVLDQSDPDALINIQGAATSALAAIMAGSLPGDLRWHGGPNDFVWIAADNSENPMDAETMLAFGRAAMAHKSDFIFAGRALKGQQPIPADYADDRHWPNEGDTL